ncbi:MAG: 2-hydroxyacid dehydrogenase [Verrucomicrobia bacterium]|nr:2-hydroxyacid dehydrogenase [Verrucomicrobiota bacterium]
MKLLAISDAYIPRAVMERGLSRLKALGIEVEVRPWEHASLVELQQANLAIEQGGPAAVPLDEPLMAGAEDVAIVVVQFAPVAERFLERLPALQVIGVLRGGWENIAVAAATQRGVGVIHTPGRNARAVAECTVGLMLAEIRNLARAHASLKAGAWRREFPNSQAIPELRGKTVGLIGYGAVGRLVAHYLEAFGSRIVVYDPYLQGDPAPAVRVDLATLLEASDIVSLHARLTPESHGLIGAAELARMKSSAVLVNTARSGLVVEAALVEALRRRTILGAALDVFDVEPLRPDHPFLELDNVTLTPHLAGSSIDAFHGSPELMAGHLENLLAGRGPVPIVNGVQPRLAVGRA